MFSRTCSQTPGASLPLAPGPEKPLSQATTMTHHRPMFPPPVGVRPVTLFDIAVHDLQTTLDLASLRREAEQEVERLLTFLDLTDGFTLSEREEDNDELDDNDSDKEPWLGSIGAAALDFYDQADWASSRTDDLEDVCEDEGAQCDDEGAFEDSGIGDRDGLLEQLAGNPRYLTGVQQWVE